MKKLLFLFILGSMCSTTVSLAQNKLQNKGYMDVLPWQFKNTTGQPVDGITIEHIEGTSIQKISIGANEIAPPIGFIITTGQRWQCSNFRFDLDNNGIVKLEIKNTAAPGIGNGVIVHYFWTKNGQQVGEVQTAKTDLTGTIPTQLGS